MANLKQVWPPSFVDEKKASPEAIIRDLRHDFQPQRNHEGIRECGESKGQG